LAKSVSIFFIKKVREWIGVPAVRPGYVPAWFTGLFERALAFLLVLACVEGTYIILTAWMAAKLALNWERPLPPSTLPAHQVSNPPRYELIQSLLSDLENGKRIEDIKKGFAAACKRAGLEDVTPHTLRHTAATWLMQASVPLWQASGFLAMSEKMLVEVYGHHHPDYMIEAADAIGRKPFRSISA
jgi:integrase